MKILPTLIASSLLVLAAGTSVEGQLIRGRIVTQEDDRGVDAAEITLLDRSGALLALARSDSAGAFLLSVPDPGLYTITASRIGLAVVRVEVEVGEKEVVEVELRTGAEAIPLEPIVVVGRRRIRQGTLDEFYDRMERMKQRGTGFFFTLEDLERWESTDIAMMLQNAPGLMAWPSGNAGYVIRMMGPGGLCSPDIYLDGLPVEGASAARAAPSDGPPVGLYPFGSGGSAGARPRYAGIPVMDLEGVEVYRGRLEQPGGYWPSNCGSIFLWRKKHFGNPFSWRNVFVAGGLTGGLIMLGKLIF